jgi:exo-beta-1,3-glucanase (GH17 family)
MLVGLTVPRMQPASAATPLEILVLGALRYLGRGWTFDDLSESTGVHAEVHRQFFHVFISFGSEVLYKGYVVTPIDNNTAMSHTHEMQIAGFHGAVGSTDATHIVMERCKVLIEAAPLQALRPSILLELIT